MNLAHVRFHGTPTRRALAERPRYPNRIPGCDPRAARDTDGHVTGLPASVLAQAGLDPAAYRPRPLERRLGACLRALGVSSEAEARGRLLAEPGSCATALSALLIGVSAFFRDPEVFDSLARVAIPVLARRRGAIRVMSLGCSTGAELYTVAILLAEAGLLERSSLLGIDCRADAVASARGGTFGDEAVAALVSSVRSRFFERTAQGWRVVGRVRRLTAWRVDDATRELAGGPWDLVLCRNLLMYLRQRTAEAIARAVTERLSPGGFLVLGKAERPPVSLGLATVNRCIYRGPARD